MNTFRYSVKLNKENQMNDKNFDIIKKAIVNAFNGVYSFKTFNITNTDFILCWDNPGAKVNRASSIRVYVNMKYNGINDNYIVDFKVESMIKDDEVLDHPYTPTNADDAMLIGFEIEELISGIEQDELAETIQDFFINYFEEQYSK